jgi:F-type H+-transporting ATPase subunit a
MMERPNSVATEPEIPPALGRPAGPMLPVRGFLLAVALVFGAGLLAAAVAWRLGADREVTAALLWGSVVAAVGTVSWLIPLRATFARGGNAFLGALVGGLAFRMVLYGVTLLIAGLRGGAHLPSLIIALFASHVLYQIVEILSIQSARRRETSRGAGAVATAVAALLALALALPATSLAAAAEEAPGTVQQDGAHEEAVEGDDGHGDAGSSEAAHGEDHGEEEHGFDVLHHVVDGREIETPFGIIHLPQEWMVAGIDMAPTKHVVWVWISALITLVFVFLGLRSTGMVSRGLGNAVEAVVVFIRDEVAGKNIAHHSEKFTPYLCTLFFFILFCNLLGLVPYGATATGNLNVTAGLALLSLIMIQAAGVRENGVVAHLKALCPIPDGVPGWLLPLYVPIIIAVEVVGIFAKPIALALRLFANMTAGHVVILSLLGLIFILQTALVAPVSVAFALFIYCLEIFVGLVQAYIFTMLTALFIGMSQHPAH